MKAYSQIQRIISLLLIFLLLIQLTGCYTFRVISPSDPLLTDSIKDNYIIHSSFFKYRLESAIIENGILTGKIDYSNTSANTKDKIHVYLKSDTVMKISTGNILSVPLESIAKVKLAKFDVTATVVSAIGCTAFCVLGIILAFELVRFSSSGGLFKL